MPVDAPWADVGIDIGKRRIAFGWPAWHMSDSFDLGKKPGPSRDWELRHMQHWLNRYIPDGARLWIDQAFPGHSVAAAMDLAETISAVRTAQDWVNPPVVVHSSTWKSAVLGNHLASKEEMLEWLTDTHPLLALQCATEDEVDAMIIGLYGTMRSNGHVPPPGPRRRRTRKKAA